jgi:ATP-dependent DNA helicase DinG
VSDTLEAVQAEKDEAAPPSSAGAQKDPVWQALAWELNVYIRRLEDIRQTASIFIDFINGGITQSNNKQHKAPKETIWVERRRTRDGGGTAVFTVAPIDIAPVLSEALFKPNKTTACVSATLTTGTAADGGGGQRGNGIRSSGSFGFWLGRSGAALDASRPLLTGVFPSPFPYATNVLLTAPTDAPLPTQASVQSFVEEAAASLAEIAGGSALVLFTSYESLRGAYTAAKPRLEALGIRCMKQGDDDRRALLAAFIADKTSGLFATDSFWEGIDAPGDTLRLVVLCRLPFKSPNDPVFEARCEAIEERGLSSFAALSLPEAVMKFRQGFGRLMRHSDDRGVVAVLDGRLLHKSYGAAFLSALPPTKTCFLPFEGVLRNVESFLFARV